MSEPSRQPLPLVSIPPGRTLLRQDDPSERRWMVVSGALREACVSPDGREFAAGILGPGDGFGGGTHRSSPEVRTLMRTRVRAASEREWPAILESRERRHFALACELVWFDATQRISMRLEDLSERFGRPTADGTEIAVPLTQSDIAALAGTTRERANRILRKLAGAGLVAREGRLYVVRSGLRSVG